MQVLLLPIKVLGQLTWVACNVGIATVPPEARALRAVGGGGALCVGPALSEEAGAHAVARVALLRVAAVRVRVALRPADHCAGQAIEIVTTVCHFIREVCRYSC